MLPQIIKQPERSLGLVVALVLSGVLAGCAGLPASGPTGREIKSQLIEDTSKLGITLVEVETVVDLPKVAPPPPVFSADYTPPPPTELVGAGDVLDISIYETGIAVFGRSAPAVAGSEANFEPSARAERLPPTRVSDEGTINIPFVGELSVKGRTTFEVERMIRQGLRGKSQNPQILVSIREGLTNSVIIGGDVARPGRLVLPTNRESLSDVIALAGGNRGEIKDMQVRIQRGGVSGEFRLSEIMSGPQQDIRIFPADRISVVRMPRSFSVLGAAGKAEQLIFPASQLSLAEAVASVGGSNPNTGDPRAIFVFRITNNAAGQPTPMVYHLNMMQARSFLLAQRFPMADKDVLYIGNAEANQPIKLVQIISQLFFPLVALQSIGNI
jgi:polysaccharide export outer membrane protein